jgi:hypothetical protein
MKTLLINIKQSVDTAGIPTLKQSAAFEDIARPLTISAVIFPPPLNMDNPCLSQFMLQYRVTLYLHTKTLNSILMSKNNNMLIFYC